MRKAMAKPFYNYFLRIAAVLFLLVFFSLYFLAGLYSRYSNGGSVLDSSHVASFDITQEGTLSQQLLASIRPGETQSSMIRITNRSEVAVCYTITIINETANITPLVFSFDGMQGWPADASDNTLIFQLTAQPQGTSHTSELCISWPQDSELDAETNLKYIGMVDYITIQVTATQVD